jgi:hypothetical protein
MTNEQLARVRKIADELGVPVEAVLRVLADFSDPEDARQIGDAIHELWREPGGPG